VKRTFEVGTDNAIPLLLGGLWDCLINANSSIAPDQIKFPVLLDRGGDRKLYVIADRDITFDERCSTSLSLDCSGRLGTSLAKI
jgi:hypothetical protein